MTQKNLPNVKQLRQLGHKLKPVVTVAGNGLSDAVNREIERALNDHELIKVKLVIGDRDSRNALTDQLCQTTGATLVQQVGNMVLLLRRVDRPNPKLSNLIRPL